MSTAKFLAHTRARAWRISTDPTSALDETVHIHTINKIVGIVIPLIEKIGPTNNGFEMRAFVWWYIADQFAALSPERFEFVRPWTVYCAPETRRDKIVRMAVCRIKVDSVCADDMLLGLRVCRFPGEDKLTPVTRN